MKKNPWCELYLFPNGTKCHAGIEEGMKAASVTGPDGTSYDFEENQWEDAFKRVCKCEGLTEENAQEVLNSTWGSAEALEEIGGKIGYCEDCPHKNVCYQYPELEDEED